MHDASFWATAPLFQTPHEAIERVPALYYTDAVAGVQLAADGVRGHQRDVGHEVRISVFQYRVGTPRAVDLPVELGHRILAGIVPVHQVLDLLGLLVIADQEGIRGIHNDKVVDTDEADMFPGACT